MNTWAQQVAQPQAHEMNPSILPEKLTQNPATHENQPAHTINQSVNQNKEMIALLLEALEMAQKGQAPLQILKALLPKLICLLADE